MEPVEGKEKNTTTGVDIVRILLPKRPGEACKIKEGGGEERRDTLAVSRAVQSNKGGEGVNRR